jgi:hypothetical protein
MARVPLPLYSGVGAPALREGTRMSCRTGCVTRDHESYGACLRAASLRVGWSNSAKGFDATAEKKKDTELQAYRDARAAGVQPAGTRMPQIRQAMELSAKAGAAFDAGTQTFSDGAHYSPRTGQVVKF